MFSFVKFTAIPTIKRFKYMALYVVQVLNKNSKEVLAFKENSFHDQFAKLHICCY